MHRFFFLLLGIFLIIGCYVRFANLNWGAPYYFHPDERNIASSLTQLSFPSQMNPHFFAYGSFPMYLLYFTGLLQNILSKKASLQIDFEQAILLSRLYSSLFSFLLIPSLFYIGSKLFNKAVAVTSAFLATTSIGFVQFAHFGTFEMWLTFGTLWYYYFLALFLEKKKNMLAFLGITMGILLAVKVTAAFLLIPTFFVFLFVNKKSGAFSLIRSLLLFSFLLAITFSVISPFVFLDFSSFLHSMNYESGVAFGTLPVFYTQSFRGTVPVIFQLIFIYPFLLNPLFAILSLFAFLYVFVKMLQKKEKMLVLLILVFLTLFLSQVFLYAKWTRYVVPTLPFAYIVLAIFLIQIYHVAKLIVSQRVLTATTCLFFVSGLFFLFAFFKTTYGSEDTRIAAAAWAKRYVSKDALILSETYDMGIVPFNGSFSNINLFNFYDLEQLPESQAILSDEEAKSEYVVLPSTRVLRTRITHKTLFPKGYTFYDKLLHNKNVYQLAYETTCDFFCRVTYLGDPIFGVEETAYVFDRPTVLIFRKK